VSETPLQTARRVPTPADRRSDALLAAALLVGGVLSAWLTAVAGIYGDEQAPLSWGVAYAVVVTAPLALRRRFPSLVAIAVCAAYFVAVSLHIPEVYVGNIAMFIAIYTVGAWVDDRRRAMLVRAALIAGMFVWLLITTFQDATAPTTEGLSRVGAFSPYVAFMLIQFLINAL
jgi:cation transport ATPase